MATWQRRVEGYRGSLADARSSFGLARQWAALILALVAVDAVAVGLSLTLAFEVRISSGLLAYVVPFDPLSYRAYVLLSVPVWLILFALAGLYRRDLLLGGVEEYKRVILACSAGMLAIIVTSFFWRPDIPLSRGWLLLAWVLSVVTLVSLRFGMRRVGYALRRRGWLTSRVLVVGANEQGAAMAAQWAGAPSSGMKVVGFLDDFKPVGTEVTAGQKVVGRPSDLGVLAGRAGAQEVVVVSGAVAWESFEEIIAHTTRPTTYTLRLSPGFYELLSSGVAVTNKSFVPLLTVNGERLVGTDRLLKLCVDYVMGLGALLICAPFIAALALRAAARGEPAFETVWVRGRHGRPVPLHTLRSAPTQEGLRSVPTREGLRSVVSAGSSKNAGLVARRPTPEGPAGATCGGLCTVRGVAMAPALWDVLAGRISLVGPRPRGLDEAPADPLARANLESVRPGILGPWLFTGHANSEEELRDDLYYIRNWTVWLDLLVVGQAGRRGMIWLLNGRRADP